MKHLLFGIIFLFWGIAVFGQENMTGLWTGEITQEEGGFAPSYVVEIYIKQEGNKITGRSYVYVGKIYASFEISGDIHSDIYLELSDIKIVDSKANEGMEWCLKQYQMVLKRKKGTYHMEGFWKGKTSFSTCIPGKIFLTKKTPRA